MTFEVDWISASIALYAAIVATGALALEIRRWVENGPKLSLSLMLTAQSTADYDLPGDERQKFILLTAVNSGNAPTTVTHIILHRYNSLFSRFRMRPSESWVVVKNSICPLPYTLEVAKIFHGQINHDSELVAHIKSGNLYVGVAVTHKKYPILLHVRPEGFHE
ncbi:hypothetical protein TH9_10870 [Thalassospira xiamenensis]|uniref:hypothetical protein n=1 Tax=Thalassospira xiamenensis TaxID=220697 RepID=UPI000DED7051|nr:hypothetical protein [Thalassospira xiamenensis]RCK33384.1 hypothetical protein TH9_10870 [Thalassospira xiamenensis]